MAESVPSGCENWRVVRGNAAKDVQTYLTSASTEPLAWEAGMKIIPRINEEAAKIGGTVAVLTHPTVLPLANGSYQFFIDVGIQRADGSWYTRKDMQRALDVTKPDSWSPIPGSS